jgi:hypothetical protein
MVVVAKKDEKRKDKKDTAKRSSWTLVDAMSRLFIFLVRGSCDMIRMITPAREARPRTNSRKPLLCPTI